MTNNLEELVEAIFGQLTVELSDETRLEDIPGWDSFQYISLIISLEDRFAVKYEMAVVEQFSKVGDIVDATVILLGE